MMSLTDRRGFWDKTRAMIAGRFLRDSSGAIAPIFALALVPMFGALGAAIDYSRSSNLRSAIHSEADSLALAMAREGRVAGAVVEAQLTANAVAMIRERFGASVSNVTFSGQWIGVDDYRVRASAKTPTTVLASIAGMPSTVTVAVETIARRTEPQQVASVPRITHPGFEAGDYNRLYVYCFDPQKALRGPVEQARSKFHAFHHNGSGAVPRGNRPHEEPTWPQCAAGEVYSFMLYNVRMSRTEPRFWGNPFTGRSPRENYIHYSDSRLVNGVWTQNFPVSLVETVICDTRDQCTPGRPGNIIPSGRNRQPQRATQVCEPGKFIYFGFEDRPPGWGWTDEDYDDITFVMDCPRLEAAGPVMIRLIK